MFVKTSIQSRPWRVFALAIVAFVSVPLLRAHSPTEWMRSAAGAVALVGLTSYAFGFRVGPLLFWRVFVVGFALAVMWKFGAIAAPILSADAVGRIYNPITLAFAFALTALVILSLSRLAELTQAPVADRTTNSTPRRDDAWNKAWQRAAEVERENLKPMSAEMAAEALSFGPNRQQSWRAHQCIITTLFIGTLVAQAVLSTRYGGYGARLALLGPALALGVSIAWSAYHSAEVILKSQQKLRQFPKAIGLLVIMEAIFLLTPSDSPRLWLGRAAGADALAFVLATWVVAATRRGGR